MDRLEAGWRQHVPAFLNAVSTVGAFGHELSRTRRELNELRELHEAATTNASRGLEDVRTELAQEVRTELAQSGESMRADLRSFVQRADGSIEKLWERIEFVRREIMFEMAYGGAATKRSDAKPAGRIINQPLIDEQRRAGHVRLNIGCGHIPLDGYINVDMRDLPGVDIVADVADIPVEPRSINEIFSAHLMEHFPQEEVRRRLLPYWRDLLVEGGTFRAIVPDGEAMLAGAAAGTYAFEDFREVLFGAQDYEGDFHFNMFTPASLSTLLQEAGFRDVVVPVKGRPNGKCFEFEIQAVRA
ncbi:hypothetical protein [Inquilinus sp.]|uniref:class I SAM-dependent methyltransferase n=1 Tax=Inquilinus sp. TaxID=1932117 RepID=UPI0031D80778